MKVILHVEQGLERKRSFVITRNTLLGRSTCCDLRIDSNDISRRHCFLLVTAEGVWIRDLSSANGTIVDNRRLEEGEEYLLHPGSRISLGPIDFSVHFELKESPAVAQIGPGTQSSFTELREPESRSESLPNYLDSASSLSNNSQRIQYSEPQSYLSKEMPTTASFKLDQPEEESELHESGFMTFFSHLVGRKKPNAK